MNWVEDLITKAINKASNITFEIFMMKMKKNLKKMNNV